MTFLPLVHTEQINEFGNQVDEDQTATIASSSTCSNDVVNEAPAVVDLASHLTPLSIRHGSLDLAWSVLAVLEDWTTPRYSEVAGTPLESKRFRVRVRGPLPGMPTEEGEFVMIVRRYGDRDGWWIAPEMR